MSLFVFNYKTAFSFACCFILENSKKLLRNFEYSKLQKAKKLLSTEVRPKLLIKKCVYDLNFRTIFVVDLCRKVVLKENSGRKKSLAQMKEREKCKK